MKRRSVRVLMVAMAVLVILAVVIGRHSKSNGNDRSPKGLLSYIQENYQREDVTEEVTLLLNFNDFDDEHRGCLDSFGVKIQQVVAWGDYHLIDSLHQLYKTSKDSCSVRAVNKEIDAIRSLIKQLKSVDYADLGVTEAELEACRIEGEVFNIRDRLRIIQAKAADEDFSDEIKRIRELAAQPHSWSFADLPVSAESLRAIEVTTIFSETRRYMNAARHASEDANLEYVEKDLKAIGANLVSLQEKYAGTHPLWDIYLSETRRFINKESSDELYKRAHEILANRMVYLMRTRNPIRWDYLYPRSARYGDRMWYTVANPAAEFIRHQEQSGYSIDHFLSIDEFIMWKRKWS